MITVKIIPDIFSSEDREEMLTSLPEGKRVFLSAFIDGELYRQAGLEEQGIKPQDFLESCDIWYEGKVISPDDYAVTEIKDCSEIVFFARPGKGGWLKTIVGVLLIVIGIIWPGVGAYTIPVGIGLMLGGICELIWPQKTQRNFEPPYNQNYGWEGVKTEYASIGTKIPICYGRVMTGGKCISQRIYSTAATSGNQRIDLLLLLSEGEIRGIRKQDDSGVCTSTSDYPWIKLENSFISGLPGISWDYRLGTLDQTVISGFQALSANYATSQKLDYQGTWYYINDAGGGQDFQAADFNFVFPLGLYYTTRHGTGPWTCQVWIEYKEEPAGDWTSGAYELWYELKTGPFYKTISFTLPNKANYSFRIRRSVGLDSEGPGWGSLWADEVWLQSYNRIVHENLIYPGTALLSITAIASDKVGSSQPNVAIKLDGRKLKYYDGSTWQNETWDTGAGDEGNVGRNLAWQIHDLIYNDVYGLGPYFDESLKASAKFKELADYANQSIDDGQGGTEARFRSDIIIDGIMDAWDCVKELLRSCHSFPVLAGAQVWPVIEKERSPIMSFGMDNVATDKDGNTTLIENWRALEDKPNVIEVQYFDAENDYIRDIVQYPDDDTLLPSDEKIKKMTVIFYNVIRRSQATRLAKYHWLVVQHIKRFIQFSTNEEAITMQPGDVFYFSHDIPQFDYSGKIYRVQEGNVIELDNEWAAVDPGSHTYKLLIRDLTDDTIEIKDVTAISAENGRHLVTYSGSYSFNPEAGDPYILIEDTTVPIKYVCAELSRDEEMRREISAQEYIPDIHDYTVDIEPVQYSDLANPNDPPPNPTDLVLVEMPSRTGFWINATVPSGAANYDHCRIYMTTDPGANWDEIARLAEISNYPVTQVIVGVKYYVKVVSFNRIGLSCANPPTASITITGLGLPPNVRGVEIHGRGNSDEFIGKDCKIQWKLATPYLGLGSGDLGGEEMGLGEGQPWYIKDTKVSIFIGGIEKRSEFIAAPSNTYTYSLEKNIEDNVDAVRSFEFRLWYRDNYNKLSGEYASLKVTNSAPSMAGMTPTVSDIPNGITVDWTNIVPYHHDVDKYLVYCDENNPPTTVRARTSQYETITNIVNLNPDVTYYIRVIPGDPYGLGTASNTVQKSIPMPSIIVPIGPSDPTEVGEIKVIEDVLEFDDCDDYTKWTSEIGGIVLANDSGGLKEGSASLKVGIDKYTCVAENLWFSIPNPPGPPQSPAAYFFGDPYTRYVTQGFKVGATCDLKRVGIPLWKRYDQNPPGAKVMIYDDNGSGKPNAKLGEATFAGITTQEYYRWADFGTPISLAASTQYHIVLCRTDEGTGDYYYSRMTPDYYGEPQYDYRQYGNSLDTLTSGTDQDILFRLFKDEATVNNHFKITSLGSKDISGYPSFEYWIKSNKTVADWLQASMGESALGEQTNNPTIATSWSATAWDISVIPAANRDAIAYFGFKVLDADPLANPVVSTHGKIWLWVDYIRAAKDKKIKAKFPDEIVQVYPPDLTKADLSPIDRGEGHIVLLPWFRDSIGQGTWIQVLSTSYSFNSYFWNSSDADGDNITLKAYLAAGTYTLKLQGLRADSQGIVDIDVNGVEVASFDKYGATDYFYIWTQTEINIAVSGPKDIKIRVHGKNASATNYQASISALVFYRTA